MRNCRKLNNKSSNQGLGQGKRRAQGKRQRRGAQGLKEGRNSNKIENSFESLMTRRFQNRNQF